MAIIYEKLLALTIPDVEYRHSVRDTILYALGVGVGEDPLNTERRTDPGGRTHGSRGSNVLRRWSSLRRRSQYGKAPGC